MINHSILLIVFLIFVYYYPKTKDYSSETKFNLYRSLLCLYFSSYSLDITINTILSNNYSYYYINDNIIDIIECFKSYLTIDIILMIYTKNKRWDLYLHHIWCLFSYLLAEYYNKTGFIYSFILFNEIISIVSGLDMISMEENNLAESIKYKIFRKNVIHYIRRPIWIIGLILTILNYKNIPFFIFINIIITAIIMLKLDVYWENKCKKIIDKFYFDLKK